MAPLTPLARVRVLPALDALEIAFVQLLRTECETVTFTRPEAEATLRALRLLKDMLKVVPDVDRPTVPLPVRE